MSSPTCKTCGATGTGTLFPMCPRTPELKFGDVCAACDELLSKQLWNTVALRAEQAAALAVIEEGQQQIEQEQ